MTLLIFGFYFFYLKVKKNYYKLARICHPDRVAEDEKSVAKEKFAIIHQAYVVLSDPREREKYDNGSDVLFARATKSSEWEHFLKPTTDSEFNNARINYQNSAKEQNDIEKEFIAGNGSLTHLLNNIPFMRIEDEMRVIEIIKKSIDDGRIPAKKIKKLPRK